jgi:ketosteroid isomerase-like protein
MPQYKHSEQRPSEVAMLALDLTSFIEQSHAALAAFAHGDPEPLKALYSRKDDTIIANPFGPPAKGWAKAAATMDRAADNYREGEAVDFERVSEYGTETLAYIIEIEHYRAKVGGAATLTKFALRVTTIFRREDGAWRIALRHADPITSARAATSIVSN